MSKMSQKGIFFLCATLLYNICSEPIKTTQTVSLQRDNHNIENVFNFFRNKNLFSSATTVTTINLI